jgi:sodium/bile acid cotransporter 7
MGVALKTKDLAKALKDVKLNLTIQFMSLIFIPSVVYGIYTLLQGSQLPPALLRGLVVLACVPVTTTTCNVLCKAADGNTAVSLFHSALGNLLGAFYTPSVLLLLLGNQSTVSFVDVLIKILETLLAPLVAGQLVHNFLGHFKVVEFIKKISGDVTKVCLLIIIWNTFCDTFSRKIEDVDTQDVVYVILLVIALHVSFVTIAVFMYRHPCFGLNRRTQVSAWFCSTQKTIVMGIPLIKIIFEGNPEIGLIQIPLLMYHPTQTISASFFLGKINRWVKADDDLEKDVEEGLLKNGGTKHYTPLPEEGSPIDLGKRSNGVVASSSSSFLGALSPTYIAPSPQSPGENDRVH